MTPLLERVAAAQGGVFTRAQALACGVSQEELQRAVRHKTLHRVRRGRYVSAAAWREADSARRQLISLRAVSLLAKPLVVGSHETAAAVLGLELWEPSYEWIHVTRPAQTGRREAGVWHHEASLSPADIVSRAGLAVTSPLRTALDLARGVDFEHGVVAVDSALRLTGAPLEALRTLHFGSLDWPGARAAGRAVAFADTRSGSVGESRTRVALASAGFAEPLTQVSVFDERGQLVGVVDFLLDGTTIVEFDGRLKYGLDGSDATSLSERLWREKQREDALRALGYQVVRLVWADLRHLDRVAAQVRSALARAQVAPPVRGTSRVQPPVRSQAS